MADDTEHLNDAFPPKTLTQLKEHADWLKSQLPHDPAGAYGVELADIEEEINDREAVRSAIIASLPEDIANPTVAERDGPTWRLISVITSRPLSDDEKRAVRMAVPAPYEPVFNVAG